MTDLNIIERAFALAASGDHCTVLDIRKQLKSEGYSNVEAHLSGQSITKQLKGICDQARDSAAA